MSPISELGRRPADVTADGHFAPWFARVAADLLNRCDLVIAGARYRIAELEAYYSGGAHSDPFSHRNPVQLEYGRWYFHRTHGGYRGGSFKGLDVAFGDGTAFFGILIRALVAPGGAFLDGPCVAVDHLLARTQTASVAALDDLIRQRSVWDTTSPLHIVEASAPRAAPVLACSRVGLSLKKARDRPEMPEFLGRAYRFLTEPRAISKGRPHLILALHQTGHSVDTIRELTGATAKTIEGYVTDFARGARATDFVSYTGKDLSAAELCQLLGTWRAKYGSTPLTG